MRLVFCFERSSVGSKCFNISRGAQGFLFATQGGMERVKLFGFGFEFTSEVKNIAHPFVYDRKALGIKLDTRQIGIQVRNRFADRDPS